jgi:hypothetical protein
MAQKPTESSHPADEKATIAGADISFDTTRKSEPPQLGGRRATFASIAADQADMPMHAGRISETPKLGKPPASTREG